MDVEVTHLRDNRYAVRPAKCLGTCGWINGKPWTVIYVTAKGEDTARIKAMRTAEYQSWKE